MTPEQWRRVEKLFYSVLEREPGERAAYLDKACAGDESLRSEVESLVASSEEGGEVSFLNFLPSTKRPTLKPTGPDSSLSGSQIQKIRSFPVSNWDRYEFIRLLGEGGMGQVYLAKDLKLKRLVALKFLSQDNPDLNQRFTQEAEAQA